ncbi:hypothetical protein D3C76_1629240 [compost metagenome]
MLALGAFYRYAIGGITNDQIKTDVVTRIVEYFWKFKAPLKSIFKDFIIFNFLNKFMKL